jgi:hypothetical protein
VTGIGGESDQQGIVGPDLFADQLADVPFAALAHPRRARVAQMRVVRPDHDPTLAADCSQMLSS